MCHAAVEELGLEHWAGAPFNLAVLSLLATALPPLRHAGKQHSSLPAWSSAGTEGNQAQTRLLPPRLRAPTGSYLKTDSFSRGEAVFLQSLRFCRLGFLGLLFCNSCFVYPCASFSSVVKRTPLAYQQSAVEVEWEGCELLPLEYPLLPVEVLGA